MDNFHLAARSQCHPSLGVKYCKDTDSQAHDTASASTLSSVQANNKQKHSLPINYIKMAPAPAKLWFESPRKDSECIKLFQSEKSTFNLHIRLAICKVQVS